MTHKYTRYTVENAEVFRMQIKGNPLEWLEYNGKTYVTGLFKMHDQIGFPLMMSLCVCQEKGWVPCLQQFVADAIRAWTRAGSTLEEAKSRAEKMVEEAISDSGYSEGMVSK